MNEEMFKKDLATHENRLNDHSLRLKEVEKSIVAIDVTITNLCNRLAAQTKSINWLIGLMASGLLGFFFYAIQTNLFK